jgi:hypothetical protein
MYLKTDDCVDEREDAGEDPEIPAHVGGQGIGRPAQDIQRSDN